MSLFSKKKQKEQQFDPDNLPRHIGIIMDGNGRWAKERGLPRTAGHLAGIKAFRTISQYAGDIGIEQVTFYAFSTENWKRPKEEVDKIMSILKDYVEEGLRDCDMRQVRIRFLGDLTPLEPEMVERMRLLEERSLKYGSKTINVALNYGGRNEVAEAMRKIAIKVQQGEISPAAINEKTISDHLYFDDLSECDLIIRPSGEYRLSNFLLWQSAYSEFYFDKILWPDYKPENLAQAIRHFQNRERRFGAI
ncbi:MAG: di-trans,poly-cis-decaprenylcistransferase [Clostridia bacterium]|nr:di-trans,poly-cis-decaprenylcistransferase [Clostridia bacterium]